MSANALLLWMSARRQGSWSQFKSAVEELRIDDRDEADGESDDSVDQFGLSLYQTIRFNLQRLGHAEFFAGAGEADWRVTPPSLAVTHNDRGWFGVVVGARSLTLLERVCRAVESTDSTMVTRPFPSYPDQVLISADYECSMAEVAEQSGCILQSNAASALLASLPSVDDPCVRRSEELPFGADWRIDRFSSEKLNWRPATLNDAVIASLGLFRFSLRHRTQVLLCVKGAAFQIPGQVGKYLILSNKRHRRQVLRYDRKGHSLSMPASCRPPFLIERALILCSGSPPSFVDGNLHYTEVPERIAMTTAALLRQEI